MSPSRRRRARAAIGLVGLAGVCLLAGCSPGYVLRAAWEEAKILERRRPIREVVHDTTIPPDLRRKLRLVQDARDHAVRVLGLEAGDSFTSYARLERDTLLLVVSAAPRFRLAPKTWWFPVVGHVPYRGFFDFREAHEEAERLRRRGYDTYVRPTAAFSTLGWLPDPVLSTALRADSVSLVETVIHEITHTTYFPSGHARFSESFANFVGHAGAISFYCDAVADERLCRVARDRWHDTRAFGRFFRALYGSLRDLYGSELGEEEMARRKTEILDGAATEFEERVRPILRSGSRAALDPERLNNAWLLSRRLYYDRLDDFRTLLRRRTSLRETVEAIVDAARNASDPWSGLDRLLSGSSRPRARESPAGAPEPGRRVKRPSPSAPGPSSCSAPRARSGTEPSPRRRAPPRSCRGGPPRAPGGGAPDSGT